VKLTRLFRQTFILLICFSLPALSQEQEALYSTNAESKTNKLSLEVRKDRGLTLNEAIQTALENNFSLKSKRAEVDIAQAGIKTAGARQNPFLEGVGSRAENTYSGGISYLFETGGKRRKRIKVAENIYKASEKDFQMSEYDLRMAVRRFYSKFATDLERQLVRENSLALSEKLVDVTKS
jgi:outer membrane protein TolC